MNDWVMVGKKKKKTMQLTRKEKKQNKPPGLSEFRCAPKVKDILLPSQVVSFYADFNNPNFAILNEGVNKEHGENEQNKTSQKKKKAVSNPVSERPRTFEAAVANVKYDELKCNHELAKIRFNENPLHQLKTLTAFFTSKLVVDQNKTVFSGKCLEYPLGSFPEKHRNFLQSVFSRVDKETRCQYFHTCLLALINELKKGNPISGYKVMLQCLVTHYPEVLYDNFGFISDLIQTYTHPKKMYISTAIMWVLAQAANLSFKHGLQVWRTFMLCFIEHKNYTRYSLDYLKYLFSRSKNRQKDALTIPEYLEFVDLLFQFYTIPKSCLTELQSSCKLFREKTSLKGAGKYFLIVLEEKIPQPGSTLYRQEMVAFLYALLREDPKACFQQWRDVYVNNLPESVLLLGLIHKDWQSIQSNEFLPYRETVYTMETFHFTNQTLYKKKMKKEGLDDCNRIVQKMIVQKSSPAFRWINLFTLMALSAFVAYDISSHGTFLKSHTGRMLKSAGAMEAYDQLALKSKTLYASAIKWLSKNGPTFLKQAAISLVPYLVLIKNQLILFSNVVLYGVMTFVEYVTIKLLPRLHEAFESYYPGITKWSHNAWTGFLQHAQYLSSQMMYILAIVIEYLKQVLAKLAEYLQENVFVREYSLDHLQKAAFQGISVVQEYVSSFVTWLKHLGN
ncbi:hypothetical protein WDU94_015134 [Cyamophila willieti]